MAHPAAIILREKDLAPEAYEALAMQVQSICKDNAVPFIVHTFPEVALRLQADGLHLPLPLLRELPEERKAGVPRLGTSCHSLEDAREAASLGATYLVAGHIFETDCKRGLPGRGLAFLQEIVDEVSLPVYGIGGIAQSNISRVRATGAKGACLMSSLMTTEDVGKLLLSLRV